MSLSKGSSVSWSDIQTIYNNLNTARKKFSFATVTVPSNPGIAKPSQISSLKNSIEELRSNRYVGNTALTNVTVPSRGALLYPNIFSSMTTTIRRIQDTCVFDNFCRFDGFSSDFFAENGNNTFHSSSGRANSFSS